MLRLYWREALVSTDQKSDRKDRVEELVGDLEDLKVTVEELQLDPPAEVEPEDLEAVKGALEQASDATDVLEDQLEEDDGSQPKG